MILGILLGLLFVVLLINSFIQLSKNIIYSLIVVLIAMIIYFAQTYNDASKSIQQLQNSKDIQVIDPIDNIPGADPIDEIPSIFSVVISIAGLSLFILGILYAAMVIYQNQSKRK